MGCIWCGFRRRGVGLRGGVEDMFGSHAREVNPIVEEDLPLGLGLGLGLEILRPEVR